jgi:hypothetical protein
MLSESKKRLYFRFLCNNKKNPRGEMTRTFGKKVLKPNTEAAI